MTCTTFKQLDYITKEVRYVKKILKKKIKNSSKAVRYFGEALGLEKDKILTVEGYGGNSYSYVCGKQACST